jgi:type IV pilus assembly protein PilW
MKQPNPYTVNSSKGFSLVELMISITLGLLIVAATLSIFASNKQAYRTTENLGRVHVVRADRQRCP